MQVQRLNFKEFGEAVANTTAAAKSFLPSGSKREAVPPPPPPPPTFSEDDVRASEAEGYKKGFLEGIEDGKRQAENAQADIDRQLLAAAERFMLSMTPIFSQYRSFALELKADVPKIAMVIAQKVAGKALEANASAVIEDIAARCLETMLHEPKITVAVHESLAASLEIRMRQLAARFQSAADIVVVPDATIEISDCRIEWKNGCLERQTSQMWQQIEMAVNDMGEIAKRDAAKNLDMLGANLSASVEQPESPEPKE